MRLAGPAEHKGMLRVQACREDSHLYAELVYPNQDLHGSSSISKVCRNNFFPVSMWLPRSLSDP